MSTKKKLSKQPQYRSSVMESLLSKYEKGTRSFSKREMIKGKIVEINPKQVIVDIGGKSEGLIAEKAYKESQEYISSLKVGDEIEAMVIVPESRDGFTILSLRPAKYQALWDKLIALKESGDPIRVEGLMVSPSGVMVSIEGLNGFVPKSQLGKDALENLQNLVGSRFEVVVIDVDREGNKIILSEKEVSEAEELALVRKAVKAIKEEDVFEGVITNIYDFGCFVAIDYLLDKAKHKVTLEGLVHISEVSWDKVRKIEDLFKVGDKVKVKIIGKSKGRLAMSIKQAIEDPWNNIEKKYKVDMKVQGQVVKRSDFGVFVSLEAGVEGLIHMTKIPPGKTFERNEEVSVYIEEIDKDARKISLGLVLTAKPVGYK